MEINNSTENLKAELLEFRSMMMNNPKKWFLEQVKFCITAGRKFLRIGFLESHQYKKLKFPCFSFKKIKPEDLSYYDENTNILIIDEKCRKNIDFIKELGLEWRVGVEWDESIFSIQRYTLYAVCF